MMIFLPTIFVVAVLATGIAAQKNLAPEGNTHQSSTFTITPCGPENAVTGNASDEWVKSLCTCTHTQTNRRTAWWRDDLPNYVYITNLTMYYRENYGPDLYGFEFYVTNSSSNPPPANDLCYKDKGDSTNYPDTYQEIHCNTIGRSVVFYISRPSPLPARAFVLMCYLEIYGCWKSLWGPNCSTPCPANCINQHCYPENGTCIWGCDSKNCLHETCDQYTSVCTQGCKAGKIGLYCDKNYTNIALNGVATQDPSGSSPAKLAIDGNRTLGSCAETRGTAAWLQIDLRGLSLITTIYLAFGGIPSKGTYSIYATNISNSWTDGTVLYNGEDVPTYDIRTLIVSQFIIIHVQPASEPFTDLNVCEIEIGGCRAGNYGSHCNNTCPVQCGGPCDVDTGNCIFGCMDGWLGDTCSKACVSGYYGNQCKATCSVNCRSEPCYHVDGECINGGCNKGWMGKQCETECLHGNYGYNCSKECSKGCVDQSCDRFNGICDSTDQMECNPGWAYGPFCDESCEDGYYGHNCTGKCHCSVLCNKETGHCSGDCLAGWSGTSCDQECRPEMYGVNCREQCGACFNSSCDRFDGNCTEGCIQGHSGLKCLIFTSPQDVGGSSAGAIGGGIGGVLAAIIIVAVVIIIVRKRKTNKGNKPKYGETLKKPDEMTDNMYENHDKLFQKEKDEDAFENRVQAISSEDVRISLESGKAKKRPPDDEDLPTDEDEEEEDGNVYNNVDTENIVKYKIPIEDLLKVINEKHQEDGFRKEFEILPKGLVLAHEEGSKEQNKVKNRFLTTWPYDHSRVVLKGDTKYDYINASYIESYLKEKAYIATQGPKRNTVRDFWHMVWQESVGKIVMVTKLEEDRKKKCDQYWPQTVKRPMIVDNFKVTMEIEKEHTIFVYRLIKLANTKTESKGRKIHHFHFTQWPDHGVPDQIKLVSFYRKVKAERTDQNGPMVVHCSAGVGRTGTFIAIDALYENGKKTGYVDVMDYVQTMRKNRMNMIQTKEQYTAVFEALLELFSVPNTSIPLSDFNRYIDEQTNQTVPENQTKLRLEFQKLLDLKPSYTAEQFSAARSKENRDKNAMKNILPHNKYRPYLMSYSKSRNDYINAVIIPGYNTSNSFLVTHCPLPDTVVDFWTMIHDHDSKTVVLLDMMNKEAPMWTDEPLEFDNLSVQKMEDSTPRELMFSVDHKKKNDRRTVKIFNVSDWITKKTIPSSTQSTLELISSVENYQENHRGPVTVVCRDGCSRSGLFVALYLVLEKMKIDDEVDIFQVVRTMQIRRPEFLSNFDQYEYIYHSILDHLEGDSLYANT